MSACMPASRASITGNGMDAGPKLKRGMQRGPDQASSAPLSHLWCPCCERRTGHKCSTDRHSRKRRACGPRCPTCATASLACRLDSLRCRQHRSYGGRKCSLHSRWHRETYTAVSRRLLLSELLAWSLEVRSVAIAGAEKRMQPWPACRGLCGQGRNGRCQVGAPSRERQTPR